MKLRSIKLFITAAVSALLMSFLTPAAYGNSGIELVDGHTDAIYVYQDDAGQPATAIKHGTRNNLYTHDQAKIVFGDDTYSDSYAFAELGIYGKEGYFALGNTEDGPINFMHPGLANGYERGTDVKVRVTALRAPGKVAIFDNPDEEGGPITPFLPGGEFFIETGTEIPIPGHRHLQWYFTHAGTYELQGTAIVTAADGSVKQSPEFVLTIVVHKNAADTRAPGEVATPPANPEPGDNTDSPETGNNNGDNGDNTDNGDNNGDNNDNGDNGSNTDNSGATPATPGTTNEPQAAAHIIKSGHVDAFHVTLQQDKLHLDLLDDSAGPATARDPQNVVLFVAKEALQDLQGSVQEHTKLTRAYYLDENGKQQETLLFPGWDSLGLGQGYSNITYHFKEVTGPGKVFLLKNKRLGGAAPALTNGSAELTAGATLMQRQPAHEHGHWVFEKPGIYKMQVQATATAPDGTTVTSNVATYTWAVDHDATGAQPGSQTEPQQNPNGNTAGANGVTTPLPQATPQAPKKPQTVEDTACYPKVIRGAGPISLHGTIKDDRTVPATWSNPNDITFAIGDAGKTKVDSNVGAITKGSQVWMISSTQVANVPWLGMNTQHPSIIEQAQGATTVTLTGFSGPGKMEVFTTGGFGQAIGERWFSGAPGGGNGSISLSWNSHVHPNWVFDAPGQYRVTLGMQTTLKHGKTVSGSGTLVFNVGSGGGVTNGHFDFGPRVGAAGDKTVWETKSGKPCIPTQRDLEAAGLAGLANTGDSGVSSHLFNSAAVLLLAGVGALRYSRRSRRG